MDKSFLIGMIQVHIFPSLTSQPVIISDYHSPLPCGDNFIGIKRETINMTESAALFAFIFRPMSFRRILYYKQFVFCSYGQYCLCVCGVAVDVNRHNRFSAAGYFGRNPFGIDIIGVRFTVHKNRFGAGIDNCHPTGGHGKSRDDDLVGGTDLGCDERQPQRVEATREPDAALGTAVGSELGFEGRHRRPVRERARVDQLRDVSQQFRLDRRVRRTEIEERDDDVLWTVGEIAQAPP